MTTAAQSLATLIDETVLKRRITVAFGETNEIEATLLVAGRRLLRIDEVTGVANGDETIGNQLTHNDELQIINVRNTLQACLQAGMPRITAIEKAIAFDDPTARGMKPADIFEAA